MANILLLSRGTGGDIFPFIHLGKVMRDRGHSVTVMTDCLYANLVGEARLYFLPLDSGDGAQPPVQEPGGLQGAANDSGNPYQSGLRAALLKERRALNYIIQAEDFNAWRWPNQTVMVAQHTSHLLAQLVAERLNIPYVMFFWSPYHLALLPALEGFYESQAEGINRLRLAVDLPPVADWRSWLREADCRLGIWPEWFAPARFDDTPEVTRIGFLRHDDMEKAPIPDELQWIQGGAKPPILITHGTSTPSHNYFDPCVEACRMLDHPGILVTRDAHLVSPRLPDGVRWFKFLPFASVMPHTGVIIHHGGIGTTGQALAAGVPQLLLAYGFDRPENARRLQALEVGQYLPPFQWQPAPIADALHRLMTSPAIKERCRHLARRSDNSLSAVTACKEIEYVVDRHCSLSKD